VIYIKYKFVKTAKQNYHAGSELVRCGYLDNQENISKSNREEQDNKSNMEASTRRKCTQN